MTRRMTWQWGPGIQGASIGAAQGWGFGYNSLALPNGHTIIRVVCYGGLALKGTQSNAATTDNIPPTVFHSMLMLNSSYLHFWSVCARPAIAEIYDNSLATPARVAYWHFTTDPWDIDIKVNHKIPATGTNILSWQAAGFGGNPSAPGGYVVALNSRILTMAP